MPCCKCVEHDWKSALQPITTHHDGKEYCILHAPNDHEAKNLDEFKTTITKRIKTTKHKEVCQLSGTIFPFEFSFIDIIPDKRLPGIDLSYAKFYGKVDFSFCILSGPLIIIDAEFFGEAIFTSTQFDDELILKKVYFTKSLSLKDAKLSKLYFRKVHFKSLVDFRNMTIRGNLKFNECAFHGSLISDKAKFDKCVTFTNVTFHSHARLSESFFTGDCLLYACIFKQGITFSSSHFTGLFICRVTYFEDNSDFLSCTFSGEATFLSCLFKNSVSFYNSKFMSDFSFKWTEVDVFICAKSRFLGSADYSGAMFNKESNFSETIFDKKSFFGIAKVQDYSDFFFRRSDQSDTPVNFKMQVNFSNAQFKDELYFHKTIFHNTVDFTYARFHSKTIFNNVSFNNNITFNESIISDVMSFWNDNPVNLPLNGDISFKNSIITNQVKISHAQLKQFNPFDIDLSKFYFNYCEWHKDRNNVSYIPDNEPKSLYTLIKKESVYRSLKKAAIENKDEFMASNWHYQEKNTCREKLKYTPAKSIENHFLYYCLCIYRICSGYGERPVRSFLGLFILLVLFYFCIVLSKLSISNFHLQTAVTCLFTSSFVEFMNYVTFSAKQNNGSNFFYYLSLLVLRIAIPLQMAFFTFSLRNKLRR